MAAGSGKRGERSSIRCDEGFRDKYATRSLLRKFMHHVYLNAR